VVKKVPDLTDHFIAQAKSLLADHNHGVLLTAITLVIEMVQAEHSSLDEFRNVNHDTFYFSDQSLLIGSYRQCRYWFGI